MPDELLEYETWGMINDSPSRSGYYVEHHLVKGLCRYLLDRISLSVACFNFELDVVKYLLSKTVHSN